jgi:hypothetical protein
MVRYRFYWPDAGDSVKAAGNIECASDEKTVATSRRGRFAAVEVWLDRRLVARVGTPDKAERTLG